MKTDGLARWPVAFSQVYFTLLAGWLLAYLLRGDWHGLLTPINALAHLLFLPLPLAVLVSLRFKRRRLLGLSLGAGVVFALLWGGLLLPGPAPAGAAGPPARTADAPGKTLRVMTYNVFGFNFDQRAVLQVIHQENPDVICFQELSPEIAAALQQALGEAYPYQVLAARRGVSGMGVISKYPLQPLSDGLEENWVGVPQTLELAWQGQSIRLVNFHMSTPGRLAPGSLLAQYTRRQQQANDLAAYASQAAGPLILAGDANSAELNDAYRTITANGLRDAWREAGFGLGFTFPRHLGLLQPAWMTRIDHIFLSAEWGIQAAHIASSAGGSDHRAVIVDLDLPSR
jgi:vancomycin resistance protein VanJ